MDGYYWQKTDEGNWSWYVGYKTTKL